MPQDCTFCQLVQNPDQLLLVGETENFYAWLDIQPRAKGHTMVVPKEHIGSVMEFAPGVWDEAMRLTREVVEKAKKGLGADGASITINIDEAGGQMLEHAYIQVFPRFQEDENAGTPTGAIFPHKEDLTQKLESFSEDMSDVAVDFEESEPVEPHPQSQKFKQKDGGGSNASESKKGQDTEEDDEKDEVRIDYEGKSIEWN